MAEGPKSNPAAGTTARDGSGMAPPFPAAELSGQRGEGKPRALGPFFLTSQVCRDALGETWAGYITEGVDRGRMVLVTVVSAEPRSRAVTHLLAAAKATLAIRHSKLLALLAVEDHGAELALVSEYLEGEPLSILLSASAQKATPIQQGVALRIVFDAARALISLRQAGAGSTFGGLSPEVIYLPAYGEPLLRHPEVASVALRELQLRRQPSVLPYRSPEQLRSPHDLAESADVFSLGVMLWEMLAMRPLFGEATHRDLGQPGGSPALSPQDVERKIRALPIPDLLKIQRPGAALSADVAGLVLRCLKRDPQERLPDLAALVGALSALPPGVLADTRAVASTVERLGGESVRRRAEQMALIAPMPLRGSSPPSSQASHFPDENAQVTLSLPRRIDEERLKALLVQTHLPSDPPPSTDEAWRFTDDAEEPPTRALAERGALAGSPPQVSTGPALPAAGVRAWPAGDVEDLLFDPEGPPSPPTQHPHRSGPTPRKTSTPDRTRSESAHLGAADVDPARDDFPPEDDSVTHSAGPLAVEMPSRRGSSGSWKVAAALALLLGSGLWVGWRWLLPPPVGGKLLQAEPPKDAEDEQPLPGNEQRDERETDAAAGSTLSPTGQPEPPPLAPAPERDSAVDPVSGETPDLTPAETSTAPSTRSPQAGTAPRSANRPPRAPRSPAPKVAPSSGAPKKSDGAFRPSGI